MSEFSDLLSSKRRQTICSKRDILCFSKNTGILRSRIGGTRINRDCLSGKTLNLRTFLYVR